MLIIASIIPVVESQYNIKDVKISQSMTSQFSSSENWTEMQKLIASDGESFENFGHSVFLSGDTAIIGASGDDDNGASSGSAYIFIRNDTTWVQQAKLLASDGTSYDTFGRSVSLSGNTAIIGAHADDDNGAESGSAYVFTRTGTTWTQQQKLLATDGATEDWFGYSVAIDGNTAVIGAIKDDDNGAQSGSAYVFTRTGTTWTQQQKLIASDGEPYENFGCSVSVSGETALIGADFGDGNEDFSGSAYVFTRTGSTWIPQGKLIASDGVFGDYFGISVRIDADTAMIGAIGDNENGNQSGSAYAFVRNGSTWAQQAKLFTSDGTIGDLFGWSVSLSGDTALIGEYFDINSNDSNTYVNVFTRTGTTWSHQQKLSSDSSIGYYFGYSVSISGNTAIIGAWGDDDNGASSGSAYIFIKTDENKPPVADFTWMPQNPIPGQIIMFDASESQDPDGTIVSYEWDWNNDGTYEVSNTIPSASHSWLNPGDYAVTLRVTDNDLDSNTTTETVTVISGNQPCYFLHITDVHTTSDNIRNVWGEALQQINEMNPLPAFVVVTGDLLDIGASGDYNYILNPFNGDDPKLEGQRIESNSGGWFITPYHIPIFFCPGNHDSYKALLNPQDFFNYETTIADSYYRKSFTINDKSIDLFSLNSGTEETKNDFTIRGDGLTNEYGNEVTEFQNDIATSTADIKIVLTHHPITFKDNTSHIFMNERQMFIDACNNYHIDLLCCGHTHEGEIDTITGEFLAGSNQEYVFTPGSNIHVQLIGDNLWSTLPELTRRNYRSIEVLSNGDIKINANNRFTSLSNDNVIDNRILINQQYNQHNIKFFFRFLYRFPHAFPNLQQLLGYS